MIAFHMHGYITFNRVCVHGTVIQILGESVVNSEMRQRPKLRLKVG